MTDEQLMSLIKDGSISYLNELFNRYSKRLYNYFLKSTLDKSESDDLTQELFMRVIKYKKSFKEDNVFEYWIFQIARNMIKDHFRKLKVHTDKFNLVEEFPEMESDDNKVQLEKEQRLYEAMKELPFEKRELLVLSKFQGMKYEQMAKLRETTVANIKVQVHRSIKELKNIYFEVEQLNK